MADVLCSIEEAREAGTLQVFEKKTKYHEYKFFEACYNGGLTYLRENKKFYSTILSD